jgi:DNA processing protein
MQEDSLRSLIALTLIKNLGHKHAKKLIACAGNIETIFSDTNRALSKLKLKSDIIQQIREGRVLEQAQKEIDFCQREGINILCHWDEDFPYRLKQCADAPLLLYTNGKIDLNSQKIIAVVGTRRGTTYGQSICSRLMEDLAGRGILVVSGLASGVDTWAHEGALANSMGTVAVLGHGLNKIYPPHNRDLAKSIIKNGALISEFNSSSSPLPGNFPARNRIIAGLSDATIVIESGKTGGSLITADIAFSYNRDVFTFPGRINDKYSEGCHRLIKENRAALIENAQDMLEIMSWDTAFTSTPQKKLFDDYNDEEISVMEVFQNLPLSIDEIARKTGLSINKISGLLLQLEFKNAVKSLPGKMYQLNR